MDWINVLKEATGGKKFHKTRNAEHLPCNYAKHKDCPAISKQQRKELPKLSDKFQILKQSLLFLKYENMSM